MSILRKDLFLLVGMLFSLAFQVMVRIVPSTCVISYLDNNDLDIVGKRTWSIIILLCHFYSFAVRDPTQNTLATIRMKNLLSCIDSLCQEDTIICLWQNHLL